MPLPLSLAGPGMVLPHLPSWGLVLNLGPMRKGEGVTLVSLSRALSRPDWPSASIQYPRAAAFSKLHRFPEICWNWQACQVLLLERMKTHIHGDSRVVYLLSDPGTGN